MDDTFNVPVNVPVVDDDEMVGRGYQRLPPGDSFGTLREPNGDTALKRRVFQGYVRRLRGRTRASEKDVSAMVDRIRVLVVDDEEVVRLGYRRVLSTDGFSVKAAGSGFEALTMMGDARFDVVLLDMRMPGMDGLEVLRAIKEQWPQCEVVVVTGYPSIESAKEAVKLGAFDYLTKPAMPEAVIRATTGAWMQKRWAIQRESVAG